MSNIHYYIEFNLAGSVHVYDVGNEKSENFLIIMKHFLKQKKFETSATQ